MKFIFKALLVSATVTSAIYMGAQTGSCVGGSYTKPDNTCGECSHSIGGDGKYWDCSATGSRSCIPFSNRGTPGCPSQSQSLEYCFCPVGTFAR